MVLKKFNDIIYKIIGVFGAFCLFMIICVVFAQVISRYLFSYSIKWSSELTVYMLTWMVFCGCAMGYRSGEIVGLTMVTDRIPKLARHVVEICVTLILMGFFVITFVSNMPTIVQASLRTSSILKMNLALVSGAWNVSATVMFLFGLEKLIHQICSLITLIRFGSGQSAEEVSQ